MQDSFRPEADYAYDAALDALVVSVYGPRSFEQARSHFGKLMTMLEQEATNRLLLDLSEAEYPFALEEMMDRVMAIVEQSEGNQIALVMDLSRREQGIVLQTLGTARWNLVRLFHDRADAIAWLRETAG